jgi:16S rRNA (guanine527-N7)-methyltransferase
VQGMDALLRRGAAQFNLNLTDDQLALFENYINILTLWNQRVNLTRIIDPDEVVVKHFLDSLSVALVLPEPTTGLTIIDVGSGAGFPGIPLKIAMPQLASTLLETSGKKADFLDHLVTELGLQQVEVIKARVEEAGQAVAYRERYRVAVARAVGALPVLVEYLLPLVSVGGWVVAQKGHYPHQELLAAANALNLLGGTVRRVVPVKIPGLDGERHLVCIQKISPTPGLYPRRSGTPAKKPL